jgi:putative N6-adenine-specific DNA methylase
MLADEKNFRMTAQTMFGMEELLAAELRNLGAMDVEMYNRAVGFRGDKGFMYKANLMLRTGLRILVPIHQFQVWDEQSLYDQIKKMAWEDYLDVDGTLAINTSLNSDIFTHSQYISQKTKDAIVDRFRDKYGRRPSVDLEKPSLRINIFINKDQCTVSLDSSGDSLHKRGYRDQTNLAPINEVLAAGLIQMTGWNKLTHFVDPMCGSGTILIEAALYSAGIPPGVYRNEFGFERWKDFDQELYKNIYDIMIGKINTREPLIVGGEISPNVVRKGIANTHEAKVNDMIKIYHTSFAELARPEGSGGVMIINPPYGERMDKDEDIFELYASIGDTLKKNWEGYDAWIITSNMEAAKHIGLRASQKIKVFNGSLECRFLKYEMYKGSKRVREEEVPKNDDIIEA